MCNITVAVDKIVNGKKEADFIPCIFWGNTAEAIGNNLGKGRLVAVDGRLQTRTYEDKQGQKRWVMEVWGQSTQFLDYKKEASANQNTVQNDNFGPEIFPDDDVPF